MGEGVVIEKYGAGSPRYSCNFVLKVTKIFLKIWSASRYVVRDCFFTLNIAVTSRKGRVSRNAGLLAVLSALARHVPQGACE